MAAMTGQRGLSLANVCVLKAKEALAIMGGTQL